MITYDTFKSCIEAIQRHEELDEKLTNLLVDKDTMGWISTGDELISAMYSLLKDGLNDKDDCIQWWVYDAPEERKYIWDKVVEENNTGITLRYNLNDLKDLYNYIIGNKQEVKQDFVNSDDKIIKLKPDGVEEVEQLFRQAGIKW